MTNLSPAAQALLSALGCSVASTDQPTPTGCPPTPCRCPAMTEHQHPITPPPELVEQWTELPLSQEEQLVVAARWGADMELEACCKWQDTSNYQNASNLLRAARRPQAPKPPSLKEQALSELNLTADPDGAELSRTQVELIRRALEQLDD